MTAESIPFTKLEGLGNDFVLIDHRAHRVAITAGLARALSDRRRGVGCDQILVVEPAESTKAHCAYRIYNADGSIAEQCGNGARCIALWLHQNGEFDQQTVLDSPAGPVAIRVAGGGQFEVTLGVPSFDPEHVGVGLVGEPPWPIAVAGHTLECFGASLGNPHLLVLAQPSPAERVACGTAFNQHPAFPSGVNVGFAAIQDAHTLELQVFERGAGPTPACGSGACAAAAMLLNAGKMRSPISVLQPGGRLVIEWQGPGHAIRMCGPARSVFTGQFAWNPAIT